MRNINVFTKKTLYTSDEVQEEKSYWKEKLKRNPSICGFPIEFKRTALEDKKINTITCRISDNISERILLISKGSQYATYLILLTGVQFLAHKYSGIDDLIIGMPISKNMSSHDKAYINDIVGITSTFKADSTFKELLIAAKSNVAEAEKYQNIPFDILLEEMNLKHEDAKEPLFNVIALMENIHKKEDIDYIKANVVFCFNLIDKNIDIKIEYNSNLYRDKFIEQIKDDFIAYCEAVMEDTNINLSNIDILEDKEKNILLNKFNDTAAYFPKDKTIQELFELQVNSTPDNVAISFEGKEYTYREINRRVNQLAWLLRENGITREAPVALMIEKSADMIISILSVLKAGGYYVPIDLKYPMDRVAFMLNDCKAAMIIVDEHMYNKIKQDNYNCINKEEIICLGHIAEEIKNQREDNLPNINNSKDIAYVMYTSGSTGVPKGVLVTHYNIVRLVKNNEFINVESDDILLQLSNYAFDGSTFDIYGPLLNGAKLIMVNDSTVSDIFKLSNIIEEEKVSIFFLTTALFNTLVDLKIECLKNVKKILFGGERVSLKHVKKAFNYLGKDKLMHMYGPTECTVYSTYYTINSIDDRSYTIPIGKPLSNCEIYILGKNDEIQPIGVVGEICVGGEGLARGYLNRSDINMENFIDNPFKAGGRLYRTGDLGKWLPSGNVEFSDRIDSQVKIRGFRIELGEIETGLLKISLVREVTVLIKTDNHENNFICAYIVADEGINIIDVKNELSKSLPDYMIPQYITVIDKMPLNLNGKVDKKALIDLDKNTQKNMEFEEAESDIEKQVLNIWKDILDADIISINDDFFNIGGHSLKAMVLLSRINKELDTEISLKQFFEIATIKGLSKYIENCNKNQYIPINKVEEKEYYLASALQKRMYTIAQYDELGTLYNIPNVFIINGKVNTKKLEKSIREITSRHEILRTNILTVDGEIVQKVNKDFEFHLEETCNFENGVENIIKNFIKPFDLEKELLFRSKIVKISENSMLFMFDISHSIMDGMSIGMLFKELIDLYNGKSVESIEVQYKDYAYWQNTLINTDLMKKQEEYWINKFKDGLPVLDLQTDYVRPSMQSFEGDVVRFEINNNMLQRLNKTANENGTTLFVILLSAYYILLSRYSGQEDVLIGTVSAGRTHPDLYNVMGMFANTILLRAFPESGKTINEFISEVKEDTLESFENQDYQFLDLAKKLKIERDASRNLAFDTMFILENMSIPDLKLDENRLEEYEFEYKQSKFDLTLLAEEKESKITFFFEYSTKLFKQETINRMKDSYLKILSEICSNADMKLKEVQIINDAEKEKILYEFNNTELKYDNDLTLVNLFKEQVSKSRDKIAIEYGKETITYNELDRRADKLAAYLINKGVKPGCIIGVILERSIDLAVGILGIMTAGCAYMPIDVSYPKKRIEYMLENSEINIIITQSHLTNLFDFNGSIIDIRENSIYESSDEETNIINKCNKDSLAYLIYTSGSTGKPKGVIVEQKAIANTIMWRKEEYKLSKSDKSLQLFSISFDGFITSFFTPLVSGATVVLPEEKEAKDIIAFRNYIKNKKITSLISTPSLFAAIIEAMQPEEVKSLRSVTLAGEKVIPTLIEKCRKLNKDLELVNEYGPTENSVATTIYRNIKDENNIPIGKPIINTKVFILDNELKLVPIGVKGEIYITGKGLAKGYYNNEELTNERFIVNPFNPNEKLYKSGDMAKWQDDGNIIFMDRGDNQIKIRGYRIELEEIERCLMNNVAINRALVIGKERKDGTKYLCAYVVADESIDISKLRKELKVLLPDYMVPTFIIQTDSIPYTDNGKVDKSLLPEPSCELDENIYDEVLLNKVDKPLIQICSKILNLDKVSINSNFFEIGGDSLKVFSLISEIHKEFNVKLDFRDIFKEPVLKDICNKIKTAAKDTQLIGQANSLEFYPLTSTQKRIFTMNKCSPEEIVYNMPTIIKCNCSLDVEKVEGVFKKIIERHDSLRTIFLIKGNNPVSMVKNDIDFHVNYIHKGKDDIEKIIREFIKPFDLCKAPLFRVSIVGISNKESILMVDVSHIIADGLSFSIIINEFIRLYEGEELEPLKLQYVDYAVWQKDYLKSEELKKQEEYWIKVFSQKPVALNMPSDFKRSSVQNFDGDEIVFEVEEYLTNSLKNVTKESGATLYMLLLASYNILLHKITANEDIAVGCMLSGRNHYGLENIVGMFINTIVIRNRINGNLTFEEFLNYVKQNVSEAFNNQDYPFEELVQKLKINGDLSHNPLFDTVFELQNIDGVYLDKGSLKLESINLNIKKSKFDFALFVAEKDKKLVFSFNYKTSIFKESTAKRIVQDYLSIVNTISQDCKIKIRDIKLASMKKDKVKKSVLKGIEFNF
ncbi:hypothetical protein COJ02_24690 [Bacillus thuringiensis]|uniref:non-ribosomal peptide synthetase n=1 Tax=Bacillus thuringiensis TaxID=1428 RepID=UPI000BF439CB|nr:non-ribosomal peptide synthetase [Bacillus thuringiensis]PFJ51515.1 hypothetical protein COJ02_24690 [Bacillus thuringiensis]